MVRKLREPPPGARIEASYEIRFVATVDSADEPTENVVGTLIVDQMGRVGEFKLGTPGAET